MATQSSAFARHQVKALFLMLATEEWRPVVGYNDDYEVSNLGRVRSRINQQGGRVLCKGCVYLKYRLTALRVSRGKQQLRRTHQLVLEAFVGPKPTKRHECRHLNGNPLDNRVVNLRWGTHAENVADVYRHGNYVRGNAHPKTKLTPSAVRDIRARKAEGEETKVLAEKYGVGPSAINSVIAGKTWGHVKEEEAGVRE